MKISFQSFATDRGVCRRLLTLVTAYLLLLAPAHAGEGGARPPARSTIRSAQLYAQDGAWAQVMPRSPEQERGEIRAHFAAVSRQLLEATPRSLDVAVTRFENELGVPLSPDARAALRHRLAERRSVQLGRLQAYARAGSFPLNRHYASEARPIFVDAEGTHCAVGHLMAMDGGEVEVNAIARANPNVLVMEVQDGPLVNWLLTSGLLQEEAALVQPGYYPPDEGADVTRLSDLVVPGAFLNRNGFRYENFSFTASSTGGAATPAASQLAVVYGWPPVSNGPGGFCTDYSSSCVTSPNSLWFGIFGSPPNSPSGRLPTGANQTLSFEIQYDVVPLETGLAIGWTETYSSGNYGGFQIVPGAMMVGTLSTTLDGGALGNLAMDFSQWSETGRRSSTFAAPAYQLHLHHRVEVGNGAGFSSFNSVIQRQAGGPVAQDDGPVAATEAVALVIPVGNNDVGFTGPVAVAVTAPPAHGTITAVTPPGPATGMTISYMPNPGAIGMDSFLYEITDGTPASDSATVTLDIIPDTDRDGVADTSDNCTLVANPGQCDTDNDGFGNHCDADLNNDGVTNATDVSLYRGWLGVAVRTTPPFSSRDMNCSGAVNAQDTVLLRNRLGLPSGPSALAP